MLHSFDIVTVFSFHYVVLDIFNSAATFSDYLID